MGSSFEVVDKVFVRVLGVLCYFSEFRVGLLEVSSSVVVLADELADYWGVGDVGESAELVVLEGFLTGGGWPGELVWGFWCFRDVDEAEGRGDLEV